jgi:hypothetical protein
MFNVTALVATAVAMATMATILSDQLLTVLFEIPPPPALSSTTVMLQLVRCHVTASTIIRIWMNQCYDMHTAMFIHLSLVLVCSLAKLKLNIQHLTMIMNFCKRTLLTA